MAKVPSVTLNNGVEIPQFGFGVFQIDPGDTAQAVSTAIGAGYRHIDTAQMYGNEAEVADGLSKAGIARDDIFITTKLANDRHGHDEALAALDESLKRLGTDHVDLFLIHWPLPSTDRYVQTWRAFEQALADGKARSIGVSNFQPAHLDRLANETSTVPAINQIELHPALQQAELREYHAGRGIATEAWSPIAQGEVLDNPKLQGIAGDIGKTVAQVVLRWHIQLGNIVFPKSATPQRIEENISIFDFDLTDSQMATISGLDEGRRTGPSPDDFG